MAKGDLAMDSLDELDDFSDSGSDYEDTLKSIKRIKQELTGLPPPKRPRRKAAMRVTPSPCSSPTLTPPDPSLQTQHSRGTPWQASTKPVTSRIQDIRAEDIYNAIYSGKTAVVTVVDEWLDSYKQSREAGLLVLINFIVQSCGCKGVVTKEMMGSMQNAEIIGTLTKDFNEDSVNYPLCTVGPQLKRFKAGLCEFAQILVRSCRNGLVYDEYLFPSLLSLLTGLSDSQVRAFRHTSTLLAMKLMTGLVEVAVMVTCQLQTTQRRWDAERSKDAHDRAPDRLEELQASIRELRENREELSSMMNATFRGVFVHRYRDQLQEIRAVCIEELGTWLKTDPDHFLNDGCLKYLGWTLHDKQSPVRLQCVQALQGLYQEKEFIGRLELFTSRFKERMLNMVLDKDSNVAVEVVNLLLMIQQGTEEGLREEECGHIYPLVYTSHRGLASAAGRFLYNKLKSVMPSDNQKKGMRGNSALFQIIISFYIQSEFHEHGAYLVDSLWDVAGSELKDWGTMTTFLLQEESLMYEEEGALIEIMICAIRQAAEVIPPVGRTLAKKVLSVKDKKIQEQDRRRITTHFIPLLPQLLAKYSADAGKVALLLKAPLYFDLKTYYSTQLMEKHLDSLLSQICGIVEKHTDAAVLQACALLVSTLCSDQYAFSTRVHLVFSQLLDTLTESFSTYLSNLLQDTADDDDIYSAATALKRIAALSSAKDPTRWKLFDPCIELLKIRMESREFEKDLMVAAMKCAALHLMWAKVNVVHSTPPEEELEHLKKEVRTFCRICQKYLFANQIAIRDQAFELLCDLLLLYSANSVQSQPHLRALYHLPSDSLRSELAAFLLDYIFTDTDTDDMELDDECFEEMKITLLQKKRNQLAGFCKLVIYGVLDLSAATDVLKHYSQYFRDFGDIIKETVSKTKLINPVQSAKTVCLCLQQMFSEMLTEIHNKQDLGTIRDLAKRLAMSFGIDLHRVREPLMALHLDGIRFALRESEEEEEQYPNAAFMEILCEFSFKLLQEDRKQLASFLKAEYTSTALSWPSVKMYQRSLEGRSVPKPREVEDRSEAISSRITPIAKRKRTVTQGSEASTAAKSLLDTSSIPSGLTTPAFTSTTQKQKAAQLASRRPSEDDAASSFPTEQDSEEESSLGSGMRRVKPIKRHPPPYNRSDPNMQHKNLDSYFTILSLIEDDIAEEEAEIENFESDDESDLTLPSTRYTAASVLDELFD